MDIELREARERVVQAARDLDDAEDDEREDAMGEVRAAVAGLRRAESAPRVAKEAAAPFSDQRVFCGVCIALALASVAAMVMR